MTQTGLENLLNHPPAFLKNKRLGLLANPASIGPDYTHAKDMIHRRFPGQLAALFSPQHGFFAEKQDNMVESDHIHDKALGIPVFSLYGETRIPTKEMLALIDVLIVDIQDVGTRVYTFIHTLALCMEAARDADVSILVLDRPNPVSGIKVEGNVLEPEYASFVGLYPIPMRHGLTIGEYALMINKRFDIGASLAVVPMKGWQREMFFKDTGLPWVLPSPNMPTPETALLYPGQVIWEGTNLSEGRGTTKPFEFFGAPWLDTDAIIRKIPEDALGGSVLRPVIFEPTSGKQTGKPCMGFQIHVTSPEKHNSYYQSLCLLKAVMERHPSHFSFKNPPYEYEDKMLPMDMILGSRRLREAISVGESIAELRNNWLEGKRDYCRQAEEFLLYGPKTSFGS
ncbi:exo-beta-N-acetylmuramidase NamZ family protein [Desulfobotulus mexicanus]|uniref:DUF1343 domain-containing protein n=1 Tax=Desulfobotulus mexicanus TaxID=2586642 RepID=A0A5Q4VCD7_9BACT|nr:DUF1343 domain-containing protein [Desulfobotulus mexicanus]TYT74633.1 DUF1343 domain-containing protein [Desulfobotulus mexicanus]